MGINSLEDYKVALGRVNELRDRGESAEANAELAELEAAVAAYEALPDQPDKSKARPTPDPYGKRGEAVIPRPDTKHPDTKHKDEE
jgi:hypothetical protein